MGESFEKIIIIFILVMMIFTSVLVGCGNKKNPFIPLTDKDVRRIGLYGYSESRNSSNNRDATEEEKKKILEMLNDLKTYDKKIKKEPPKNGKPSESNMQIFLKENEAVGSNLEVIYIVKYKEDRMLIGESGNRDGYVIESREFSDILYGLRE